ncbi:MAG: GTPase Era [Candidatus Methylomirabilales bacterium]
MWGKAERTGEHRAGVVAIIGRPNVGKSTLMNRLLRQKVSIVSPKPQTTRNRIAGIRTTDRAQVVFLDTPGIHRAGDFFNRAMVAAALATLTEVDLVLWMVDAAAPETDDDALIAENLKEITTPVLLAINKVDLVPKPALLPLIERLRTVREFVEIVPISCTAGDNLDRLEEVLVGLLPAGEPLYPAEQLTDQPERFIIGELIREQVFQLLHQEIPYAVAVEVEAVREREAGQAPFAGQPWGEETEAGADEAERGGGERGARDALPAGAEAGDPPLVDILATLYVEKDSQKGILIGAGGQMLKRIGERARREIEVLLGARVFLKLWVKSRPKWRQSEEELRRLGYLRS